MSFTLFKKKRIYLDHAAATPVRPAVLKAMLRYWSRDYGNPGAIHKEGVMADRAVDEARSVIARTLRVRADNIAFTSGGTESNNLWLQGSVQAMQEAGVPYEEIEIISTKLEHPSILETLAELQKLGCQVIYAPVDSDGLLKIAEFEKLLSPKTRLVTLAYANSEIGVVTDLNRVGRLIRAYEKKQDITIHFHTDASQAPLWLPCALDALGVDAMTLDAGKFCGPKGGGVLAHRDQVSLKPISHGGGQEDGLRPGTENVPVIIGTAKALEIAQDEWQKRSQKVTKLRDYLISELTSISGVVLNGSGEERIANNVNVSIPGLDSEYLVVVLDTASVAASTKSACSGKSSSGSYVVSAISSDASRANSTLRLTLGENTTKSELKKAINLIKTHIRKTRENLAKLGSK